MNEFDRLHQNENKKSTSTLSFDAKSKSKQKDKENIRDEKEYYLRDSIDSNDALLKREGWERHTIKQNNAKNLKGIRSMNAFEASHNDVQTYFAMINSDVEMNEK